MNGVALAVDAPSVAESLHDAGYATALIGKAHFEPMMDPFGRFAENSLASLGIPTIEQDWFDGRRGVHPPAEDEWHRQGCLWQRVRQRVLLWSLCRLHDLPDGLPLRLHQDDL